MPASDPDGMREDTMAATTTTKDQLILDHVALVERIAHRMAARYPSSVEVDDLVSIGMMGLIDAATRFDDERLASFTSYAAIRIKGAIVDGLRKLDWVPRTVRARNREIEQARAQVQAQGNNSSRAVAATLGVDLNRLNTMERDSQVITQVSMWERRNDTDQEIADTLASDDATPSQNADRNDLRRLIFEAMKELPERDREIVRLYYYEDRSFREIGDALGVTESRVSQLHSRVKRRLKELLNGAV